MRNEKINLALLLLLSLLLSIYLFFRTYVISLDGAFQYIPLAKIFVMGSFKEALASTGQQPLYSFLIALAYRLIPDFEIAGKIVASLFGVLILFPVYYLGKRIFDERIAFFSTLLLTLHPYIRRFSADVLKESTYLFFLALALWFAWRTIQGVKKYPYLFIPLLSVLVYLVRPDGVEILIVVFLYVLFFKKFDTPGDRWKVILLLVLSSFFLLLPYLFHLKETTGVWTLSKAKTIDWFLGLRGSAGEISLTDRILFTFKDLHGEILTTYHFLYILLLGIGLWRRRSSIFKEGERFLLLFCALHYVVLSLLVLNLTEWSGDGTVKAVHFSGRHVLPLLLFSVFWVGEGIFVLYNWISKIIESSRFLSPMEIKTRSVAVWAILFILILAIVLPKTLKPQRYERLPEKWAGAWMKAQWGSGLHILTTIPRVAYYGGGTYERVDLTREKMVHLPSYMTEKKIPYLVLRERERSLPEVEKILEKNFKEIQRFEGKGMERVFIYQRNTP